MTTSDWFAAGAFIGLAFGVSLLIVQWISDRK